MPLFANPFRPGAGHKPLWLAGREAERGEFVKLLRQEVIHSNLLITGLRGVGKTVLLETLKPMAIAEKWIWIGADLGESASTNEETMVNRLLADLSVITSGFQLPEDAHGVSFFVNPAYRDQPLNYPALLAHYQTQPGLAADKLKGVLELVWSCLSPLGFRGVIFAYDEAQTLSDHPKTNQYPVSLLLDVFQSIQRKGVPFMLVMAGLPTLLPRLIETRNFAERMFTVQVLGRLPEAEAREAIQRPLKKAEAALQFDAATVQQILENSGGYPYFLQYLGKELFDVLLQHVAVHGTVYPVAIAGIVKKLDKDFFVGPWQRLTVRQQELLAVIASLPNCEGEFTVNDIVVASRATAQAFSASHANQMLASLADEGLVFKNRRGQYSFALPMLGQFIRRREREVREIQEMQAPVLR